MAGSMPPPHESRLLQRAVRPPGLPASQCPPPLPLPPTPPNRPPGSMMGGPAASPRVTRRPLITPRPNAIVCVAPAVSGLESFGVRCPAPLVPPDHLLPGALGHRSLHCLGAGPALDRGPPIQAPPAYCPPATTAKPGQPNYHDRGFQVFKQRSLYLVSHLFRSISKAAQVLFEVFQRHMLQAHLTTQPRQPKTICLPHRLTRP